MNIFIHHDGALGDVLLSLQAIHSFKEEGWLHLAGRSDVAALLRGTGAIDEASSSDDRLYTALYHGDVPERTRAFLARFARAVIFAARPDPAFVSSIRSVIADTQMVITIPPDGTLVSVAEYRRSQLERRDPAASGPILEVPPNEAALADNMLTRAGFDGSCPLISVHPGSGGKAKCWPLENYLELVTRLRSDIGAFVVILSGPAEDASVNSRIEEFTREREGIVSIRNASLMTVAAVISRCDFFIGNDSGIAHLAAALGRGVLVIFGPTDPVLWTPIGETVDIIRVPQLAELRVERVYARACDLLPTAWAAPGAGRGGLPEGRTRS